VGTARYSLSVSGSSNNLLLSQGGGEVDLKLGLLASDFIKAYDPFVADCTYDAVDGEEK
jgi:hypothetical protein